MSKYWTGCAMERMYREKFVQDSNLCWPGEYFYGGVGRKNVSNNEWELVICA